MKRSRTTPVATLSRAPRAETRVLLFTLAGGRCEFDNCNRYLLAHHVTHREGNFAEMAHIVAFRPTGPRGSHPLSAADRNDVTNLMLLCPTCHKLIDDNPGLYPVNTLKSFKGDHEARIHMLTEAKADKQTVPLVLKATIGSSPVAIPAADMQAAVAPFYLDPREIDWIDLTARDEATTEAHWQSGADTIRERVRRFYERLRNSERTNVSVFALAPIPYLAVLGTALSNKFPTALFQRHRDTQDWKWKEEGAPVEFECRIRHSGTDATKVALVLSVSGSVPSADYSSTADEAFSVYEIAPSDTDPSFAVLRLRASLEAFRARYRATLQTVRATHPEAQEIHIFPALPAPAAVAVGLDWMPKAQPTLVVYDKKGTAGFEKAIDIRAVSRGRLSESR